MKQSIFVILVGLILASCAGPTTSTTNAFVIKFIGFKSAEVENLTNKLRDFQGFVSLDLNQRIGQSLIEYEYITAANRAETASGIKKSLEIIELRGRVSFGRGIFTVEKINLRGG